MSTRGWFSMVVQVMSSLFSVTNSLCPTASLTCSSSPTLSHLWRLQLIPALFLSRSRQLRSLHHTRSGAARCALLGRAGCVTRNATALRRSKIGGAFGRPRLPRAVCPLAAHLRSCWAGGHVAVALRQAPAPPARQRHSQSSHLRWLRMQLQSQLSVHERMARRTCRRPQSHLCPNVEMAHCQAHLERLLLMRHCVRPAKMPLWIMVVCAP